MRQVCSEFAESVELLGLLLHARDFANTVEHRRDTTLRHRRDGGEHLGESALVNLEGPAWADGIAVATVTLHTRVGKFAGHLARATDPESDGASVMAAH